ncbi:hypothetical protein [Vibrio nigripulchritudo]|uniref:hypothetical protein n=1 Tax=Vibrio nigripulchritudo TaxID=28173 RepID=UPI0005FA5049|nr:hypothetical protein [Vibrio nigripulchritudo]KJY78724.1 hypothetical protein TW74_11795 [Vibrio nigripulchritudo]
MKYLLVMFGLLISIQISHADTAQDVNAEVSKIERLKEGAERLIVSVESSELENTPPKIDYYFNGETKNLILARITSSKGIFLVVYSYYFKDGKPIKYLVEYIDHPENPAKQAIIYSDQKVIWSNVEAPVQEPSSIKESFRASLESIIRFR